MPQADPKFSAGARYERAAFRAYLRRKVKNPKTTQATVALVNAIDWIIQRQARYDKRVRGLGR